jgi:membrane protein required for colicin V production
LYENNILIFVNKILNYLDIFIVCLIALGFYRGFSKGLIIELTSILALILGAYGSLKFSGLTFDFISTTFPNQLESIEQSYIKIFSFAFTFVVIIVSISVAGKALTKIAKILFLGFLNKLFGGLFGAIKYVLIVSFCFVFFENINSEFSFIDNENIESTFLYRPILNGGNQLLSFFNLSSSSINFFN